MKGGSEKWPQSTWKAGDRGFPVGKRGNARNNYNPFQTRYTVEQEYCCHDLYPDCIIEPEETVSYSPTDTNLSTPLISPQQENQESVSTPVISPQQENQESISYPPDGVYPPMLSLSLIHI